MNMSTEVHPSVEDIAAFLDRRLSREDRARVIAHLADCGDCYEVFAESVQFQIEEGEEDEDDEEGKKIAAETSAPIAPLLRFPEIPTPAAPVIPLKKKEIATWIAAVAAVAVISAGGVSVKIFLNSTMPELTTAAMVDAKVLSDKRVAVDGFWDPWVTRGTEDEGSGLMSTAHETLLGAHAVDLSLSLRRNDRDRALNDLAFINGHMSELLFWPDQTQAYKEIQRRIYEGAAPKDFLRRAEEVEATLPVKEAPYFALGKWTEAGRLSAVAENPDFFLDSRNTRFLRAFLRKEEETLDESAIALLEKVRETLGDLEPSALPYPQLREQLGAILTHYQEQVESDSGV